jgi:hypothetical protein
MKTDKQLQLHVASSRVTAFWRRLVLLMVVAALVAACGGNDEPTPEPTTPPPTVAPTVAPTEATPSAAQAESPLAQPASPLTQAESPLAPPVSAPYTEAEAIALAALTTAPEPAAGMATVSGVLYSFGTIPGAIRGTQVYLEAADEVDGEYFPPSVSLGPKVADGDIIVESNDLGQVQIEVPPGHYYMAVWTIYDWRLVVAKAGEEAPRLITLEEGDQLDLGVLYTYWP